jgi:hypothetical protein
MSTEWFPVSDNVGDQREQTGDLCVILGFGRPHHDGKAASVRD